VEGTASTGLKENELKDNKLKENKPGFASAMSTEPETPANGTRGGTQTGSGKKAKKSITSNEEKDLIEAFVRASTKASGPKGELSTNHLMRFSAKDEYETLYNVYDQFAPGSGVDQEGFFGYVTRRVFKNDGPHRKIETNYSTKGEMVRASRRGTRLERAPAPPPARPPARPLDRPLDRSRSPPLSVACRLSPRPLQLVACSFVPLVASPANYSRHPFPPPPIISAGWPSTPTRSFGRSSPSRVNRPCSVNSPR